MRRSVLGTFAIIVTLSFFTAFLQYKGQPQAETVPIGPERIVQQMG